MSNDKTNEQDKDGSTVVIYENMLLLETLGFKENSPSLNSFQQSTF